MFLLNLEPGILKSSMELFTFHYVSIKSRQKAAELIAEYLFTFHYVSIKSLPTTILASVPVTFTFHYVSIKSTL